MRRVCLGMSYAGLKSFCHLNVAATLDTDTDEILDYSGNPEAEEPWRRRGMVMGHAQSKKTTNYADRKRFPAYGTSR